MSHSTTGQFSFLFWYLLVVYECEKGGSGNRMPNIWKVTTVTVLKIHVNCLGEILLLQCGQEAFGIWTAFYK
jgi:hypothetical protein